MPSENPLIRVDGEPIGPEDAIRALKSVGSFSSFVQDVVEARLVRDAARKAGVSIGTEELQAESDRERQQLGLHGAADTQAFLVESGLTVEDWEAFLEHRLLRRRLVDRDLGADAIRARFASTQDEWTQVALSAIAVDSRSKAVEILDQIRGEEARFDDLARRHSLDEDSRHAGGMVGWVSLASLPPEIATALSGSRGAGETIGPVECGKNWYVLRLEAIDRPELTSGIEDEIRDLLFAEWLDAEKKRRRIEVA